MKLATIRQQDGIGTPALVVGDDVIDLTAAAPGLPADMPSLLAALPEARPALEAAVAAGNHRSPLADVVLGPPVPRPGKFFAIGLNYADHVAEASLPMPAVPEVFSKMPSSVAGPYDDVARPLVSEKLDYEGELGFVIARRCKHVPRERAHEVIAGYVVVNDYSVRDYQLRTSQWTLGKSFDTHGVVGPWIVTPDELDPHTLSIRTIVNGEVRQQSNTRHLIFDCFYQVELLSSACTLEPGDIVSTGTPGGVGIASDRFLAPGDLVRVEIDGIGAVENRIVAEPAPRGLALGEAAAASR